MTQIRLLHGSYLRLPFFIPSACLRRVVWLTITFACFCLYVGEGHAAVFNIGPGDVAGLKSAINTANANGEADTINLATTSAYTLTAIDNSVNGSNGLPAINNDAAGLDLTINGNGATIRRSSAAGTPEFRILQVSSGAELSCNRLTIADGKATGSFPGSAGGGIFSSEATMTLTDCVVRENTADGLGAGIYSTGSTVLQHCILNGNTSRFDAGGGIFNGGTITVENSTFYFNKCATYGGGITTYPGTPSAPTAMTVQNTTFEGNFAQYGGGLSNFGGTLALRNSTISGNAATAEGGGLHNLAGTSTVVSNTFCANNAPNGGGIIIPGSGNCGFATPFSKPARAAPTW
jgi:hypothetical protein